MICQFTKSWLEGIQKFINFIRILDFTEVINCNFLLSIENYRTAFQVAD